MKKNFYTISFVALLAVLFTACTGKPSPVESTKGLSYADTVGLAEFQEWKTYNERVAAIEAYKKSEAAATPAVSRSTARRSNPGSSSNSGTMISGTENQAKTAEKKGWSKAAKGVAIGAGSGAILGAVIHKRNRALGAVIGGVVGGGVGYGIGRSKDKKDGRY
ncbi:MAG TPA: YMGG-like glycine zipper-containing protein [Chitinophagaceae bacterium]|nr:YMGG-like glycine zipper-containing protein [Chitinophagaceae bacterium]